MIDFRIKEAPPKSYPITGTFSHCASVSSDLAIVYSNKSFTLVNTSETQTKHAHRELT